MTKEETHGGMKLISSASPGIVSFIRHKDITHSYSRDSPYLSNRCSGMASAAKGVVIWRPLSDCILLGHTVLCSG